MCTFNKMLNKIPNCIMDMDNKYIITYKYCLVVVNNITSLYKSDKQTIQSLIGFHNLSALSHDVVTALHSYCTVCAPTCTQCPCAHTYCYHACTVYYSHKKKTPVEWFVSSCECAMCCQLSECLITPMAYVCKTDYAASEWNSLWIMDEFRFHRWYSAEWIQPE